MTVGELYMAFCYAVAEPEGLSVGTVSDSDFITYLNLSLSEVSEAIKQPVVEVRIQAQPFVREYPLPPGLKEALALYWDGIALPKLDRSKFYPDTENYDVPSHWTVEEGKDGKVIVIEPVPYQAGEIRLIGVASVSVKTIDADLGDYPESTSLALVLSTLARAHLEASSERSDFKAAYCQYRAREILRSLATP